MISIFLLWTFTSYEGTFWQHLQMEHISTQLIHYSRVCGSYQYNQVLLDGGLLPIMKATEPRFPSGKVKWKLSLRKFKQLRNICHLWPFICSDCHSHNPVLLSSFMIYHEQQQVPLLEQELFTLPEHEGACSNDNCLCLPSCIKHTKFHMYVFISMNVLLTWKFIYL